MAWSVDLTFMEEPRMFTIEDRIAASRLRIAGFLVLILLAAVRPSAVMATVEYDFFLVEAFDPNYDLREVILRDLNESGLVSGTATRNGFYDGFIWTEPTDKVIVPSRARFLTSIASWSSCAESPSGSLTYTRWSPRTARSHWF
jgi:hypothetical protein